MEFFLKIHKIKKGFDINVLGEPTDSLDNRCINLKKFCIYPTEFEGIKPKLHVKVGDYVKRGGLLFTNKRMDHITFRSPACGIITEINLGDRRFPNEIIIESSDIEESEIFEKFNINSLNELTSDKLKQYLLFSGLWPMVKQRPFNKIADPASKPKAIFINACNSAPFQANFNVVLKGNETL